MSQYNLVLLFSVLTVFGCMPGARADTCKPLSAEHETQIISYFSEHLAAPDGRAVSIISRSLIPDSCYYKLVITESGIDHPIVLFLTPDQQFLTTKLFAINSGAISAANYTEQKLLADASPRAVGSHAQATLVEFGDFQCPDCRRLAEWYKELPVSLRDQIVLVYKYLPTSPNAWGQEAAQLAACVQTEAPDSFWNVFDYIFTAQETISLENVRQQILNQTGLLAPAKAASVATCYDDRKGAPIVQRDVALAASLHVTRTPTMFMNGRRVVPIFSKNDLVELITRAVDEHSTLAAQ